MQGNDLLWVLSPEFQVLCEVRTKDYKTLVIVILQKSYYDVSATFLNEIIYLDPKLTEKDIWEIVRHIWELVRHSEVKKIVPADKETKCAFKVELVY